VIENVTVHGRDVLDPETKRVLKKFVHVSMAKLRGKGGWAYAERENKKRLHKNRVGLTVILFCVLFL